MTNIAMATLGLCLTAVGVVFLFWVTAKTPATEWQPIETAPKDGTEIELTWMDGGEPAEIYPMRWNAFAENPLFQDGKGIWAMHSRTTNELFMTWTDHDPAGAPTHWRPIGSGSQLADATNREPSP